MRIRIKHYRIILAVIGLCLSLLVGVQGVFAQEQSAEAAAKELANPASSMASLDLNFQYYEYTGDLPNSDDQNSTSILFQPILPFPIGDKGRNIILRPAIPLFFDQPIFNEKKADFDDLDSNMGDIGFDCVFAGTEMKDKHNGYLWGIGAAGTFPTATDDSIAGDQWRLGPEVFGGIIRKWGLVGVLVSNQWNVAGSNDDSFSTMTAQYFYAYGLGNGWQITSDPIITCDWNVNSEEAWSIPVGIGIAKTVKLGKKIWKFQFEVQKYVAQPDSFGPDWFFEFTITPVIKNPFVFYR